MKKWLFVLFLKIISETVGNFDIRPVASRYEREFLDDMALLGVRPPDVLTRVSE
jgi:cysteinyl-tRNA synthetase